MHNPPGTQAPFYLRAQLSSHIIEYRLGRVIQND